MASLFLVLSLRKPRKPPGQALLRPRVYPALSKARSKHWATSFRTSFWGSRDLNVASSLKVQWLASGRMSTQESKTQGPSSSLRCVSRYPSFTAQHPSPASLCQIQQEVSFQSRRKPVHGGSEQKTQGLTSHYPNVFPIPLTLLQSL